MQPIAIFGGGGFAREVLGLIEDLNQQRPTWEMIGFLDDDPAAIGREIHGYPVIGGQSWLQSAESRSHLVFGIGSPVVKRKLALAVAGYVASFPTLIHPSVVRSARVTLGSGIVVTAGNILTTDIRLGDFVMLNLMCTVGHDAVLLTT
jgi:FlaA1/EpsC-like NDP-sugar epimerase